MLPFIAILPGIYVLWQLVGNVGNDNFRAIWLPICVIAILVLITIVAYVQQLRFTTIALPYDAQRNAVLLKQFLQQQHLAFHQYADAPEVFQIISRARPQNDMQETVVFIADDNRILVNSHFTKQRWGIRVARRRYRQIVRMLRDWLQQQPADGRSSLMQNTSFTR